MAQQTINIGASPNDGTGTPLRTAFQYTNSNFSELYTAVGPSGNNIVVPGNATISGDLTVDTNVLKVDTTNNRVGVVNASPSFPLDVVGDVALTGNENYVYLFSSYSIGNNSRVRFRAVGAGGGSGYGGDFRISTRASNNSWNTDVLTIDSSANCIWTDGAGGTRMTLNSNGLGVGGSVTNKLTVTVTPPTSNSDGLVINGPSSRQIIAGITGATYSYAGVGANQNLIYGGNAQLNILGDNQNVRIATSAGSYLLLDTSGNVGIGVTPSAWGAGYKALQLGDGLSLMGSPLNGTIAGNAWFDGTNWKYITANPATLYYASFGANGSHVWSISSGVPSAGGTVSLTNAMTLDASGNLLVARTGAGLDNTSGVTLAQASIGMQTEGNAVQLIMNRTTSDGAIVGIRRNNLTVGDISVTTTGTTYNTISDYRLKESVQPLVGGLARISALKPSVYKWKSDGSNGEGFLAHELAEVVPLAVTGEKDAVNDDGSIKAQGVDLSKVVPILVAAIQELTAEVNALKNA